MASCSSSIDEEKEESKQKEKKRIIMNSTFCLSLGWMPLCRRRGRYRYETSAGLQITDDDITDAAAEIHLLNEGERPAARRELEELISDVGFVVPAYAILSLLSSGQWDLVHHFADQNARVTGRPSCSALCDVLGRMHANDRAGARRIVDKTKALFTLQRVVICIDDFDVDGCVEFILFTLMASLVPLRDYRVTWFSLERPHQAVHEFGEEVRAKLAVHRFRGDLRRQAEKRRRTGTCDRGTMELGQRLEYFLRSTPYSTNEAE